MLTHTESERRERERDAMKESNREDACYGREYISKRVVYRRFTENAVAKEERHRERERGERREVCSPKPSKEIQQIQCGRTAVWCVLQCVREREGMCKMRNERVA